MREPDAQAQGKASQLAELGEQEERMLAFTVKVAAPGRDLWSIYWPERSVSDTRLSAAAKLSVSGRPI